MTQRIAHLSDLHFGAVAENAELSLADDLRAQAPDAVVVTGDLTQRARPAEFAAARRFLDGLSLPVLAVPGNHDIPGHAFIERLTDPFRRWHEHFASSTEGCIAVGDTLIVGLNTVRRVATHLDWSAGRISRHQIARLAAFIGERRGSRVVLALHHPPTHPDWAAHRRSLGRSSVLQAALGRLGVVAVLAGHLHRPFIVEGEGTAPPEIVSGSSLSWRDQGQGNSYNLIDVGADGVAVTVRRRSDDGWHAAPTTRHRVASGASGRSRALPVQAALA